jgi:hypothetical protein
MSPAVQVGRASASSTAPATRSIHGFAGKRDAGC